MTYPLRHRFGADLKSLAAIRQFIQEASAPLRPDTAALWDLILAVDETTTNIVLHGYRGGQGEIEVEVRPQGDALVVCLRDEAPPFDPTLLPAPDVTLPLDERPVGGLGIYLARQMTDHISYRRTPRGGNELTLVKKAVLFQGGDK
jgi:serine/threonine-protein kinase RsbW